MKAHAAHYRACIICRHACAVEPFCVVDTLRYVRCGECGLVFVDRLATDAAMSRAYTGGWLRKARRRLLAPWRQLKHHRHFDASADRGRRIFDFAAAHTTAHAAPLRFLDIGCNRGFLLAAGVERGADVYGIELVAELMLPFCNTYPQLRDRIFSDKLSQVAPQLPDGVFDLVSAIDVIEHFENPASDLREIHRLLREDGILVVQTPDAGCEQAQAAQCAWGALKPLEHLHLFDRGNFVRFAGAAGFSNVRTYDPFEHADGNFVAVLQK